MGWCSATEIMDTAIKGAEEAVRAVVETIGDPAGVMSFQSTVDEALSPFVRRIATTLRDSDWDCIEESEYFERFPQEMLGKDDKQYRSWLHDQIKDREPDDHDFPDLVVKLKQQNDRMEGKTDGG